MIVRVKMRRRWVWIVAAAAVVVAVPIAVAVGWLGRETFRAAQGASAPEAATTAWMYALRDASSPGAGPYVDGDGYDQVAKVRTATMRELEQRGAWLTPGRPPAEQPSPPAGTVVEWWARQYSDDGGTTWLGSTQAWRFQVAKRLTGWWITGVEPPAQS